MANGQALSRLDFRQIPGLRQLLLLVGIAAAIALGIAVVLWSRSPSYQLLYSNLPAKDSAAIVQALKTDGIDYRLANDAGAIMVPASKVNEARMKLASRGLPKTGSAGLDTNTSSSGFGTSRFMEKTQYRHRLEKDLGKTIASLKSVKGAVVHLALPEQSVFVRKRKPGSASVLVNLYPGRELDGQRVEAIVNLVAASVPELSAPQVTVVDQKGTLMTDRANDELALSDHQFQYRRKIEHSYAGRIEQILAPLVGADNVHAQVVARMDFTHQESTRETYNPDDAALRSEQTRRDVTVGDQRSIGIPGALSNRPVAASNQTTRQQTPAKTSQTRSGQKNRNGNASGDDTQPRDVSTSATRNYELSHSISHIKPAVGRLSKLSVAVVIDNPEQAGKDGKPVSEPIPDKQMSRLTALVKNAVGFDTARGDSVTVVNAPFRKAPTEASVSTPTPDWWEQPTIRNYIKQGLGVLIALVLILAVLRPLFRNLVRPAAPAAPQLGGPSAALPAGDAEELGADQVSLSGNAPAGDAAASPPTTLNYDQKVGMAKRVAGDDPRRVAQVVQSWVGEDG